MGKSEKEKESEDDKRISHKNNLWYIFRLLAEEEDEEEEDKNAQELL